MTSTHETLDKILRETVSIITGQDLGPRPGQRDLAHDILTAMEGGGHVAGIGPTGLGKSQALLGPAMTMAALADERTLMSTESLALQAQILDKDAPDCAEATERVTGYRPTFSVHKGFSNHACFMAVHSAAEQVVSKYRGTKLSDLKVNKALSESARKERALNCLQEAFDAVSAIEKPRKKFKVNDREFAGPEYLQLLKWSLSGVDVKRGAGDRSKFTHDLPVGAWQSLSVTPQECPGAKACPFADVCLPLNARKQSKESDIVVTNHALLGIQAATSAPIVLGNKKLGNFHHLMVDEAHALPSAVRNGGAVEISQRRVISAISALRGVLDRDSSDGKRLVDMGNDAADELESQLNRVNGLAPGVTVKFVPALHTGVGEALMDVRAWANATIKMLPSGDHHNSTGFLKIQRVRSRLESLYSEIGEPLSNQEDDENPTACWMENEQFGRAYKVSPVDVSQHIAGNLYRAKVVEDQNHSKDELFDEDGNPLVRELSVTMVSATLPMSFRSDTGIGVSTKDYPSPFDQAYGKSIAYCPKLSGDELVQVANMGMGNRWKFDTDKHALWCTAEIVDLVRLNNGSALILSANKKNGERYAEALRRETDLTIYSQWDGKDSRILVNQWRKDTNSVMVGTRSLMTGVDAKGDTCTLVIIDRVPRAMGNVVDDARVETIMSRLELDRWSADRHVYVSDAALLLEQAMGRLVRTMDDFGMVAVLDPRIVPGSPLSYNQRTASAYLHSMRRFTTRRSSKDSATKFLKGEL